MLAGPLPPPFYARLAGETARTQASKRAATAASASRAGLVARKSFWGGHTRAGGGSGTVSAWPGLAARPLEQVCTSRPLARQLGGCFYATRMSASCGRAGWLAGSRGFCCGAAARSFPPSGELSPSCLRKPPARTCSDSSRLSPRPARSPTQTSAPASYFESGGSLAGLNIELGQVQVHGLVRFRLPIVLLSSTFLPVVPLVVCVCVGSPRLSGSHEQAKICNRFPHDSRSRRRLFVCVPFVRSAGLLVGVPVGVRASASPRFSFAPPEQIHSSAPVSPFLSGSSSSVRFGGQQQQTPQPPPLLLYS